MSSAFIRFSALCAAVVALAGCGGGSGGNGGGGGGGNPTTVTFTFSAAPVALAAKIGTGDFTAQTPASGKLSLTIPDGTTTFAVAYQCAPQAIMSGGVQVGQIASEVVLEASTADGTSFTVPCTGGSAGSSPPMGTFTGKVDASAIAGVSSLSINVLSAAGDESSLSSSQATTDFSLQAPTGNDRVQVLAFNNTLNGFIESFSLAAAKNFDNQTVPGALNDGNTVVFSAADETTPQPITYKQIPAGYAAPAALVIYEYSGGGGFLVANAAAATYPALPAPTMETGDFYAFTATAYSQSIAGEGVTAFWTSTTGGPASATCPAPWTYAGPAPAALPTFNVAYTGFSSAANVVNAAEIGWFTGTNSEDLNLIQVTATGNSMGGTTSLPFPDLSGVPGFLTPAPSGKTVTWAATIGQSSHGFLQPAKGTASGSLVENAGVFTVP